MFLNVQYSATQPSSPTQLPEHWQTGLNVPGQEIKRVFLEILTGPKKKT